MCFRVKIKHWIILKFFTIIFILTWNHGFRTYSTPNSVHSVRTTKSTLKCLIQFADFRKWHQTRWNSNEIADVTERYVLSDRCNSSVYSTSGVQFCLSVCLSVCIWRWYIVAEVEVRTNRADFCCDCRCEVGYCAERMSVCMSVCPPTYL